MSKPIDSVTYEPFGERVCAEQAVGVPASRIPVRRLGVALFWAVVILLVGARIHLMDAPTIGTGARASAPQDVVVR